MGLNWYGGAQGASKGLETILGVQSKNIDMLYDQITRENHQRFQSAEAEKQRQFATSERMAGQGFTASEKALDREVRREDIEATKELRLAQQQATEAYQQASIGVQQQRNEMTGQANQALAQSREADDARLQAADDQQALDQIDEKIAELQNELNFNRPDDWVQQVETLKKTRALVSEYGGAGARGYMKIDGIMAGHPESEFYSRAYALMDAGERMEVDREALRIQKKVKNRRGAYARAIDAAMGTEEAQTPAPEEKPPQNRSEGQGGASATPEQPMGEAPEPEFAAASPRARRARQLAQDRKAAPEAQKEQAIEAIAMEIAQREGKMQRNRIAPGARAEIMARAEKEYELQQQSGTQGVEFIAAAGS